MEGRLAGIEQNSGCGRAVLGVPAPSAGRSHPGMGEPRAPVPGATGGYCREHEMRKLGKAGKCPLISRYTRMHVTGPGGPNREWRDGGAAECGKNVAEHGHGTQSGGKKGWKEWAPLDASGMGVRRRAGGEVRWVGRCRGGQERMGACRPRGTPDLGTIQLARSGAHARVSRPPHAAWACGACA